MELHIIRSALSLGTFYKTKLYALSFGYIMPWSTDGLTFEALHGVLRRQTSDAGPDTFLG